VIDIDPKVALRRGLARGSGEDRFEGFGADFQLRLREGFLALAAEFPARCRVVSGAGSAEEVSARIAAVATEAGA
jgi:dTMP kinase